MSLLDILDSGFFSACWRPLFLHSGHVSKASAVLRPLTLIIVTRPAAITCALPSSLLFPWDGDTIAMGSIDALVDSSVCDVGLRNARITSFLTQAHLSRVLGPIALRALSRSGASDQLYAHDM